MNHRKMQEDLLALNDPELPGEVRREIMIHLQKCKDCQDLRNRWQRIRAIFFGAQITTTSGNITRKVMERLADLEVDNEGPDPIWGPMSQWLFPTLGYAFAFLLMFAAIAHWEPYLNGRSNTEEP